MSAWHHCGSIPVISSAGCWRMLVLLSCWVAQRKEFFSIFTFFKLSAPSLSKSFKLLKCSPCFYSMVKHSSNSALICDGFSSLMGPIPPLSRERRSPGVCCQGISMPPTLSSLWFPHKQDSPCPHLVCGSFPNVESQVSLHHKLSAEQIMMHKYIPPAHKI